MKRPKNIIYVNFNTGVKLPNKTQWAKSGAKVIKFKVRLTVDEKKTNFWRSARRLRHVS